MKRLRLPQILDGRSLAAGAVTLWIAISPWAWGFSDSHSAVANHVSVVFGFAPLALLIVNLRPAAFVTLLGGIWLAISPWLLGYASDHAAWINEPVTGLLLIAVCASAAGFPIYRRDRARLTRSKSSPPAIAKTADSRG